MKPYSIGLGIDLGVVVTGLIIAGWLSATILMLTLDKLERMIHQVPHPHLTRHSG